MPDINTHVPVTARSAVRMVLAALGELQTDDERLYVIDRIKVYMCVNCGRKKDPRRRDPCNCTRDE